MTARTWVRRLFPCCARSRTDGDSRSDAHVAGAQAALRGAARGVYLPYQQAVVVPDGASLTVSRSLRASRGTAATQPAGHTTSRRTP